MPSLKELYENSLATGNIARSYQFFGSTENIPFNTAPEPAPKTQYQPNTPLWNEGLASLRDVERITKFFVNTKDGAKGPLWLTKQVGLHLSNPELAHPDLTIARDLTSPRVYNPLGIKTLASVAGNAGGLHVEKHGILPTNERNNTYLELNTDNNGQVLSRLQSYWSKDSDVLLEYKGGPDSTLGIGKTTVKKYDGYRLDQLSISSPNNQGFTPWSQNEINNYGDNLKSSGNKFQDFRQENNNPQAQDYSKLNIHNRLGVTSNRNKGALSNNNLDSINALTITKTQTFYEGVTSGEKSKRKDFWLNNYNNDESLNWSGEYGKDIVKFRIEILDNDQPVIGGQYNADTLVFRAYLTNFNDSITADWNSFNFMGRGEKFHTYKGFDRSLTISYNIFAHSAAEMAPIYTKLNYLVSSLTPDYSQKLKMRGNYVYMTVGDYLYRQPGIIKSITIGDMLNAPWETAIGEKEPNAKGSTEGLQHEVPKFLTVGMTFVPIHDFLPRRNRGMENHTATFITPNWGLYTNRYLPTGSRVPTEGTLNDYTTSTPPPVDTNNVPDGSDVPEEITSTPPCVSYELTNTSTSESGSAEYTDCLDQSQIIALSGSQVTSICALQGTVSPSPYVSVVETGGCGETVTVENKDVEAREEETTIYPLMYLDGTKEGVSYKALQAKGATDKELAAHLKQKNDAVKAVQKIYTDKTHRLLFYFLRCNRTMPELGVERLYNGPSIDGIFGPATEFLTYQALGNCQIFEKDIPRLSDYYSTTRTKGFPLVFQKTLGNESLKTFQKAAIPNQADRAYWTGNYYTKTKAYVTESVGNYVGLDPTAPASTPDEWNNLTVINYISDYESWPVTGSDSTQPTSPYNVYAPCTKTSTTIPVAPGFPNSEKYYVISQEELDIYTQYTSPHVP